MSFSSWPLVQGISVDADGALVLDDAIFCQRNPDGGFTLRVMVVHVPYHVQQGTALDLSAMIRQERGLGMNSTAREENLFPDAVRKRIDIFPGEGVERPVVCVEIVLDRTCEIQGEPRIFEARFESLGQVWYKEAERIILTEQKTDHPLYSLLFLAAQIADGLFQRRQRMGGTILEDVHSALSAKDPKGEGANAIHPIVLRISQEFMILANSVLATFALKERIPLLYLTRVGRPGAPHTRDDRLRWASDLIERIEHFDGHFERLKVNVRQDIHEMCGYTEYRTDAFEHWGFDHPYVQCTSPLWRYLDLVNVRQIVAYIRRERPPYSTFQLRRMANFRQWLKPRADGGPRSPQIEKTAIDQCQLFLESLGYRFAPLLLNPDQIFEDPASITDELTMLFPTLTEIECVVVGAEGGFRGIGSVCVHGVSHRFRTNEIFEKREDAVAAAKIRLAVALVTAEDKQARHS